MVRLSWEVVLIVIAALAGATFLGYEHDLDAQVVGGIYTAILSGVLVGHFTIKAGNGYSPPPSESSTTTTTKTSGAP